MIIGELMLNVMEHTESMSGLCIVGTYHQPVVGN